MEEAERLCDRVLIMDHGKVLADDGVDTAEGRSMATWSRPSCT